MTKTTFFRSKIAFERIVHEHFSSSGHLQKGKWTILRQQTIPRNSPVEK